MAVARGRSCRRQGSPPDPTLCTHTKSPAAAGRARPGALHGLAQASRNAEQNKVETLLGMSQQRLGAANAARDAATQSIMGGVGSIVGAGGDMIDNR